MQHAGRAPTQCTCARASTGMHPRHRNAAQIQPAARVEDALLAHPPALDVPPALARRLQGKPLKGLGICMGGTDKELPKASLHAGSGARLQSCVCTIVRISQPRLRARAPLAALPHRARKTKKTIHPAGMSRTGIGFLGLQGVRAFSACWGLRGVSGACIGIGVGHAMPYTNRASHCFCPACSSSVSSVFGHEASSGQECI